MHLFTEYRTHCTLVLTRRANLAKGKAASWARRGGTRPRPGRTDGSWNDPGSDRDPLYCSINIIHTVAYGIVPYSAAQYGTRRVPYAVLLYIKKI